MKVVSSFDTETFYVSFWDEGVVTVGTDSRAVRLTNDEAIAAARAILAHFGEE